MQQLSHECAAQGLSFFSDLTLEHILPLTSLFLFERLKAQAFQRVLSFAPRSEARAAPRHAHALATERGSSADGTPWWLVVVFPHRSESAVDSCEYCSV